MANFPYVVACGAWTKKKDIRMLIKKEFSVDFDFQINGSKNSKRKSFE